MPTETSLTRVDSFPFDSRADGYDADGYPVYDRAVGASLLRSTFAKFFSDGVFPSPGDALQIAKDYGRHIGVITYAPVPVDERVIEDLFQTEITFTSGYDNPQRNLRCVMEMKDQGIDVVVGGGVTVQMAQMNGIKNVLITTRPETLENAVDEAVHMMEIIQRDKLELEEISQIIRYASEAILLTDLKGHIMMANQGAEELLGELTEGRGIEHLGELPQLEVLLEQVRTGRAYRSELVSVGETMLLCSQYPIFISGHLMGVALFLQHSAKIQKLEQSIRTRLDIAYAHEAALEYAMDGGFLVARIRIPRRYTAPDRIELPQLKE